MHHLDDFPYLIMYQVPRIQLLVLVQLGGSSLAQLILLLVPMSQDLQLPSRTTSSLQMVMAIVVSMQDQLVMQVSEPIQVHISLMLPVLVHSMDSGFHLEQHLDMYSHLMPQEMPHGRLQQYQVGLLDEMLELIHSLSSLEQPITKMLYSSVTISSHSVSQEHQVIL